MLPTWMLRPRGGGCMDPSDVGPLVLGGSLPACCLGQLFIPSSSVCMCVMEDTGVFLVASGMPALGFAP